MKIDKTVCDICGKDITLSTTIDTYFSIIAGQSRLNGTDVHTACAISYDICKKCTNKAVSILKSIPYAKIKG